MNTSPFFVVKIIKITIKLMFMGEDVRGKSLCLSLKWKLILMIMSSDMIKRCLNL